MFLLSFRARASSLSWDQGSVDGLHGFIESESQSTNHTKRTVFDESQVSHLLPEPVEQGAIWHMGTASRKGWGGTKTMPHLPVVDVPYRHGKRMEWRNT